MNAMLTMDNVTTDVITLVDLITAHVILDISYYLISIPVEVIIKCKCDINLLQS